MAKKTKVKSKQITKCLTKEEERWISKMLNKRIGDATPKELKKLQQLIEQDLDCLIKQMFSQT